MSTVIDDLPAPDETDHPEDGGARWRLDNGWVVVAVTLSTRLLGKGKGRALPVVVPASC